MFFYYFLFGICCGVGVWGLGMGDWGLGIGPNPQSPIPNPQSPIPNPQLNVFQLLFFNLLNYKLNQYNGITKFSLSQFR